MKKKVLTTSEIAKYCNVTQRTVVQWISEGKIKDFRTPGNHSRVHVEDFVSFLKRYHIPIPDEFEKVSLTSASENKTIERLRDTMSKMELALGSVVESIVWTDVDGHIHWSNESFDNLVDIPHIMLLGKNISDVLPLLDINGQSIPEQNRPYHLIINSKQSLESEYAFKKNEKDVVLKICGSAIDTNGKQTVVLSISDITRRKQDEKKLKEVNKWLNEEVSEKTKEIKKNYRDLKVMYERQKEFTSTVSHELRTPLASIKSSIDIIDSEVPGGLTDDQKMFLGKVKSNVDRLGRLINDVLDLSKLESGKMDVDLQEGDLYQLIKGVIQMQNDVAQEKGVDIKIGWELEKDIKISFDKDRMIQVFSNLINNALKFTEKGSVTLAVKESDDLKYIEVSVIDTGIGIKKEDLDKLFGKFQQVGDGTNQVCGTGLGLAICKEIIHRHKGEIWVESEFGKGSAFKFTLPVA